MKMQKAIYVLRTAGVLILWGALSVAFAQEDSVRWLNTYAEAIKEAKRTHKPIFLEFRCEA